MADKTKNKVKEKDIDKIPNESFYLNENVQKYDFSDFVKITSSPRGLILSFGIWCPEQNKFGLFKEILLPFDVADGLSRIIVKQIEELEKKNLIEKVDRAVPEKKVKSK